MSRLANQFIDIPWTKEDFEYENNNDSNQYYFEELEQLEEENSNE